MKKVKKNWKNRVHRVSEVRSCAKKFSSFNWLWNLNNFFSLPNTRNISDIFQELQVCWFVYTQKKIYIIKLINVSFFMYVVWRQQLVWIATPLQCDIDENFMKKKRVIFLVQCAICWNEIFISISSSLYVLINRLDVYF
jgi:hypothetical protein